MKKYRVFLSREIIVEADTPAGAMLKGLDEIHEGEEYGGCEEIEDDEIEEEEN